MAYLKTRNEIISSTRDKIHDERKEKCVNNLKYNIFFIVKGRSFTWKKAHISTHCGPIFTICDKDSFWVGYQSAT